VAETENFKERISLEMLTAIITGANLTIGHALTQGLNY